MAFYHGPRVVELYAGGGPLPVPSWPDTQAPTILTPPNGTIAENNIYAIILAASEPVAFQILTGADGAAFGLVGDTLTLPAKDFEAGKILFVCNLRATDAGGNATDFSHSVTITNVDEQIDLPPVITSAATGSIAENAVYTITLTANEPVTFAKRAGADSAAFSLVGSTLTLPAQDYEAGKTLFVCNLRATDSGGNSVDFTHNVTITDVNEIPANALLYGGEPLLYAGEFLTYGA